MFVAADDADAPDCKSLDQAAGACFASETGAAKVEDEIAPNPVRLWALCRCVLLSTTQVYGEQQYSSPGELVRRVVNLRQPGEARRFTLRDDGSSLLSPPDATHRITCLCPNWLGGTC